MINKVALLKQAGTEITSGERQAGTSGNIY
jgi:hypothetical protein